MALPQTVILTPQHRDVHEVHGGDLARLPVHVPLLLGGLQLPAGARLLAQRDRRPRARGARQTNKIGLVSTAVCDHPEIDGIVDDLAALATRCPSPRCGSTT
jgi:hypothetical protein